MENSNKISEVTEAFNLPGELKECIPYGNGHINDTYRLTCETPGGDQALYSAENEQAYL